MTLGIAERAVDKALESLGKQGIVIAAEELRTKHIQYAYRLLDEVFSDRNRGNWRRALSVFLPVLSDPNWSLKGVSWLLDAVTHSNVFRFSMPTEASPVISTLLARCAAEGVEIEWAAGCLWRLFQYFGVPIDEMLNHRELLLRWTVQSTGLLAYFCSNFVNLLINESKPTANADRTGMAKAFNDDVDVASLVSQANRVSLDDFYTFGSLLNRLAFYGPRWSKDFVEYLDWFRLKAIILRAGPNDAEPVDKMLYGICRLAQCSTPGNHLRYIEEVIPYIVKATNAQPARTLNEMHDTFWSCLGFAPTFLRGGHEPGEEESRVARAILSQLDPNAFAEALATFRPRELEGLARSFELIHEVEPDFIGKVAACVRTEKVFSITLAEWRLQSRELQNVLGVFAQGRDRQPARAWVSANQNVIEGPLKTRLAWISPELAVSFHKTGKGVVLVAVNEPQWFETSLAMFEIMKFDRTVCAEIVEQHLPQLEAALYRLSLRPLTGMAYFFRLLHELSPTLFDQLLDRLDLDNPEAKKTIDQVVRSQPNERRAYAKLARKGAVAPGRMGQMCKALLERLGYAHSNASFYRGEAHGPDKSTS